MAADPPSITTRCLPFGDEGVAEAVRLIHTGQPVALPTETVYGLAADATDARAVAAIYAAKGRPSFNPLIVHVPDVVAARVYALLPPLAERLAATFWPGPLTLVLPRRPGGAICDLATAGLETVAIRVPAHPAMRTVLVAADRPLAAPSANRSGSISPTTAAHVLASLGGRIPLVLDAGACPSGIESTIVAVANDHLRLLRPGPIDTAALEAAAGVPVLGPTEGKIEAPGQLASHYCPDKPLRLNANAARAGEYLIGFGTIGGDETLSATGDMVEAAANLFGALHRADASGAAAIAVAPVPQEGIGAAINDRLARAAVRG